MNATAQQYATAWYELLSESDTSEWDAISERLLQQLRQDSNMRLLPEIIRLAEEHENKRNGVTPVTVRSAHEVDEQVLKQQIEQIVPEGTTPQVNTVIDESLIGGLQIETSNERWDLSLRGQLRALSNHIND